LEETNWDAYGLARHPKCANCMLHSGFEATAVNDMLAHPLKALRVAWGGPQSSGLMAPDLAMGINQTAFDSQTKAVKETCSAGKV